MTDQQCLIRTSPGLILRFNRHLPHGNCIDVLFGRILGVEEPRVLVWLVNTVSLPVAEAETCVEHRVHRVGDQDCWLVAPAHIELVAPGVIPRLDWLDDEGAVRPVDRREGITLLCPYHILITPTLNVEILRNQLLNALSDLEPFFGQSDRDVARKLAGIFIHGSLDKWHYFLSTAVGFLVLKNITKLSNCHLKRSVLRAHFLLLLIVSV